MPLDRRDPSSTPDAPCTQSDRHAPNWTRRSAVAKLGFGAAAALIASRSSVIAPAEAATWPGASSPQATPESVGLNKSKLLQAQSFATRFAGGAGCVIRHGKLAHRWGSFSEPFPINSATKS